VALPFSGTTGIECRSGGASGNHQVVFAFATPIISVSSASVTPGAGGTGSVSGPAVINGNQVTVNLSNVSNAQTLTINLVGVSDGTHSANVSVPMGVLLGDVTANKVVSNTDVASIKTQVAAPVAASNFRNDVNANGIISNTDVSTTKAQVGTVLP
jgi:hypothetical protein